MVAVYFSFEVVVDWSAAEPIVCEPFEHIIRLGNSLITVVMLDPTVDPEKDVVLLVLFLNWGHLELSLLLLLLLVNRRRILRVNRQGLLLDGRLVRIVLVYRRLVH